MDPLTYENGQEGALIDQRYLADQYHIGDRDPNGVLIIGPEDAYQIAQASQPGDWNYEYWKGYLSRWD